MPRLGGFPHRQHRGAGWIRSHAHRLGTAEIAAPDARHPGECSEGLPMSRLTYRRPAGFCLSVISLCLAGLLAAVVLAEPAAAQKRVALVIGNAAYTYAGRLPNPGNDATDMAAALKGLGIEVILGLDLDKPGFDAKLRQFSRALADADVGILFYAGHGL